MKNKVILSTRPEIILVLVLERELKKVSRKYLDRPLKKRCRILPTGGLGVSPSFNKSPKIGGLGG